MSSAPRPGSTPTATTCNATAFTTERGPTTAPSGWRQGSCPFYRRGLLSETATDKTVLTLRTGIDCDSVGCPNSVDGMNLESLEREFDGGIVIGVVRPWLSIRERPVSHEASHRQYRDPAI